MNLINGLLITEDGIGLELVTNDIIVLTEKDITIYGEDLKDKKFIVILDTSEFKDKALICNYRELELVNALVTYFRKQPGEFRRLTNEDKEFISFFCNSSRMTSGFLPLLGKQPYTTINGRFKIQKVGSSLTIHDNKEDITSVYVKVLYITLYGLSQSNVINLCLNHFIFSEIDLKYCV